MQKRRILIIEDNAGDVRLMREALRDLEPPIAIQVASDEEEALRLLNEETAPNMIFLDFNLPKSDARALLRRIKEDVRWRVIPVAVLTTSDAERDVREAYELHANCYLRKPVDLDGFLNTVREATRFWLEVAYTPGISPEEARHKSHLL